MPSNESHLLDGWETDHEQIVSQALTAPDAPLVILLPDKMDSTLFADGIAQDSRVREHFAGRCIVISCHGGHTTDSFLQDLAAQLDLRSPGDLFESIANDRTFVILDGLEAIHSPTDADRLEETDMLLATLCSIDNLTILLTFRSSSLPHHASFETDDDPLVEPEAATITGSHPPNQSDVTISNSSRDTTAPVVRTPPSSEISPTLVSNQLPVTSPSSASTAAESLYVDSEIGLQRAQPKSSAAPSIISHSRVPPAKPTVFHGRDKEVERLVAQALTTNLAPLGIVGPGGIGKTALALRVLHDTRLQARFAKERFFISCERATSPDDVLAQLALKLGVKPSQNASLWPSVLNNLRSRERIFLVIDNFETIWSPMNEFLREESEVFLAQLAVLDEVTILVTTRGNTLPEIFEWANRDTAEIDTLSSTAARQTFEDLSFLDPELLASQPESDALTNLLREVDFMPLAITLLARLDDLPSCLLQEWSEHYTEILEADRHDGTRRELSVEVSIKMSLAHLPAETSSFRPRQLLSVLGQLPAGLFPKIAVKLLDLMPRLDAAAKVLLRHSLVYHGGLGELRLLSPVRHYISTTMPMSSETRSAVEQIYIAVGTAAPILLRPDAAYDVEIPNIIYILTIAADASSSEVSDAIARFASYCPGRGYSCLHLLQKLLPNLDQMPMERANCLLAISTHHNAAGERELAIGPLERAVELYTEAGQKMQEGTTREGLSVFLRGLNRHKDADIHLARSQEVLRESDWSYWAKPAEGEDPTLTEQRFRDTRQARLQDGDPFAVMTLSVRILEMVMERRDREAYINELELMNAMGEQLMPGTSWLALNKITLAEQYLVCRNLNSAEALLIDAHAMILEHNERSELAWITRVFAMLHSQQNRFGEAIDLAHEAARLYRECGEIADAENCEELANRYELFSST